MLFYSVLCILGILLLLFYRFLIYDAVMIITILIIFKYEDKLFGLLLI
jgi:hypothetical protein